MDEPGRVSDAWPGEGPRRVQPDRARLQSPPGAEYRRVRRVDGRRGGLKGLHVKVFAELVDTIATSSRWKQIFSVKPTAKLIADLSCSAVSQRRLYWHEAVFTRSVRIPQQVILKTISTMFAS